MHYLGPMHHHRMHLVQGHLDKLLTLQKQMVTPDLGYGSLKQESMEVVDMQ